MENLCGYTRVTIVIILGICLSVHLILFREKHNYFMQLFIVLIFSFFLINIWAGIFFIISKYLCRFENDLVVDVGKEEPAEVISEYRFKEGFKYCVGSSLLSSCTYLMFFFFLLVNSYLVF